MKEFIVQTDMDLNGVVEFEGAGGVSFKPHGELIRCKDCKHHKGYDCDRLYGFQDAFTVKDDDFCSRAERKES